MPTGHAPLTAEQQYAHINVPLVANQLFDPENVLASCDLRHERYLTTSTLFRGRANPIELEYHMLDLQNRLSSNFVEWIPDNVMTSTCRVPSTGMPLSGTLLTNNTAVSQVFQLRVDLFSAMYHRRAFLSSFIGEGMDQMEFDEAESNLRDLMSEYQQYGAHRDVELSDNESVIGAD